MRRILIPLCLYLGLVSPVRGQWQQTPLPPGGATGNIVHDKGRLITHAYGQILLSEDCGATWRSEGLAPLAVLHLAAGSGVLYASDTEDRIWRSEDLGRHWESIFSPENFAFVVEHIQSLDVQDQYVAVGTNWNIYVSRNKGQTWERSNAGHGAKKLNLEGPVWYAMDGILYRSADKGNTWEKIFSSFYDISDVDFSNGKLFALYRDYPRVAISPDYGLTWTFSELPVEADLERGGIACLKDTVWVFSQVPCFERGVFRSVDAGQSWQRLPMPIQVRDVKVFCGKAYGIGWDGGAIPMHQADLAEPFPVISPGGEYFPYVFSGGGRLVAATDHRVFVSTDKGRHWDRIGEVVPCMGKVTAYASAQRLALSKWAWPFDHMLYSEGIMENLPPDFEEFLTADGEGIYAQTNDDKQLLYWPDGAQEPERVDLPLDVHFHKIWFSKGSIWASGYQDMAFWTTDKGVSWDSLRLSDLGECPSLLHMARPVSLAKNYVLIADCLGRLWRWRKGTGAPELLTPEVAGRDSFDWTEAVMVQFASDPDMVVADGRQIFYSTDAGEHWWPGIPAFPEGEIHRALLDGDVIWAYSFRRGLWHVELPPFPADIGSEGEDLFYIQNPTRHAIRLKSRRLVAGQIRLRIIDTQGRLMGEHSLEPGYAWEVPVSGLLSGLYFLDLEAGGRRFVLKWLNH